MEGFEPDVVAKDALEKGIDNIIKIILADYSDDTSRFSD
jgi:hypothetical protein